MPGQMLENYRTFPCVHTHREGTMYYITFLPLLFCYSKIEGIEKISCLEFSATIACYLVRKGHTGNLATTRLKTGRQVKSRVSQIHNPCLRLHKSTLFLSCLNINDYIVSFIIVIVS